MAKRNSGTETVAMVEHVDDPVVGGAAPDRGGDADEEGERHGDDGCQCREAQGVGEAAADQVRDRHAVDERHAGVAGEDAGEPVQVA